MSDKTRFQEHVDDAKAKLAAQRKAAEQRRRVEARFHAAANAVAKTKAGQDFLVGLFHLCGYNRPSVVVNPQALEISLNAMAYNDARRSVYIDVRKHVDPELRAQLEVLAEQAPSDDAAPTQPKEN